jgi:hypothetical protein
MLRIGLRSRGSAPVPVGNAGRRVLVEPPNSAEGGKELKREFFEPCVCSDCTKGEIDPSELEAAVRFSLGYLRYSTKVGPLFDQWAVFYDQKKHKFAHSLCAMDQGVTLELLRMGECALPRCGRQFFCEREPKEGCILVELGEFQRTKRGLGKFEPRTGATVHWACARKTWNREILRGLMGR